MAKFIMLVAGWFLGILSKPLSDHLTHSVLGPKLTVRFRNDRIFVLHTTANGGSQATPCVYVRVKVTNSGKRSARNCRGFLVGFEQMALTGQFELIDGGDESIQLIWAHSAPEVGDVGFDMSPGVSRYLDVLSTYGGSPHFNLEVPRPPNIWSPYLSQRGTYRFTIQVSAEEADPRTIRLLFDWDGNWQDPKVYPDTSACENRPFESFPPASYWGM